MNNVALIISTYDDSEDLWYPLEQTYQRHWKDIECPIYLCTNHKQFKSNLFHSLQIGTEISWSDNLQKSLKKITQDYVLLTFDDLFLRETVDNSEIKKLMKYVIENDLNYLQFYRSVSLGRRINKQIFKKSNTTKYKNSTIWSFWKKKVLLDLLDKNESCWEFEVIGNKRSFKLDHFYSTRSNIIPFMNGVIKGKWEPRYKTRLLNSGIKINNERESLTTLQSVLYHFRDIQFDFLTYLIHKIY
tara:strand:- start:257 stop:988 length:732 start_codon:yes stop_codon:yes gene_type:complete